MRQAKNWPWESSPCKDDNEEIGKSVKKDGVQETEESRVQEMLKSTSRINFHIFKFFKSETNPWWNSWSLFYYTGKIILNYVALAFTKVPNWYSKKKKKSFFLIATTCYLLQDRLKDLGNFPKCLWGSTKPSPSSQWLQLLTFIQNHPHAGGLFPKTAVMTTWTCAHSSVSGMTSVHGTCPCW